MHFPPQLHDYQFQPLFERMLEIVGAPLWQRRIQWIGKQIRRNELLKNHMVEHHSLELQFAKAHREWSQTDRITGTLSDPAQYLFYVFVTQFMLVYERLSAQGQGRLRGMLVGGLKDPEHWGLLALQQELATSAHLMLQGFDVDFVDLEGNARWDFVLRRNGIEMDAECKMISCDVGRKIPRLAASELLYLVQKQIGQTAAHATGGRIVHIRIPDRLTSEQSRRDKIVAMAVRTYRTGVSEESAEICQTKLIDFPLQATAFGSKGPDELTMDDVRSVCAEYAGNKNPQAALFLQPKHLAVITLIESARADTVLESIFDTLAESAKNQLSGERPAAMFVQIHDLSADAIVSLAEKDTLTPALATGLQIHATRFLNRTDRQYVHTIGFRSHGTLSNQQVAVGNELTTVHSEAGQAYVFNNPHSPVAGDPRYAVFERVERASPIVRT